MRRDIHMAILACIIPGLLACSADADAPVAAQTRTEAVTVSVDGERFGVGDTVEVTVHNGLEQSVWTHDQMSWCSVVSLERWDGKAWMRLGACPTTAPRLVVALAGGSENKILLVPDAEARGTCRASLVYSTDEGFSFESARLAASTTFTIE